MQIKEIMQRGVVNSKQEYYFLYENGILGNRPLTWNSIDEIAKSKWEGKICIRCRDKSVFRNKVKYNLTLEEALTEIEKFKEEGIPPQSLTFNQAMPDEHLTIQGELMRTSEYLDLTYSKIKKPMNLALKEEQLSTKGIEAFFLMKKNLDPSSYEDLQTLFDIFPNSIVEFSSYDIPVGNIPNRNTIFWEVRNY